MYSTKIIETPNGNITQLQLHKIVMACPYKTSTAKMEQVKIPTIGKGPQEQIRISGYVTQPCDNLCPLFEVGDKKIIIHCGCTPRTFKLDPPDAAPAPAAGKGLSLI